MPTRGNKESVIDIHTHGLGALDTNTDRHEDILKLAAHHRRRGTGYIVPAVYPAPIKAMRQRMEAVRTAAWMDESIAGIYLEGPFLNPRRAGALDKKNFLKPSIKALMSLIQGYEEIIRVITIAPELKGAANIIERCASLGITVSMGHSDATYKETLKGMRAGARGVTHLFNAMRPMHHREGGLAAAGLMEDGLYVEVIADGAHLSAETLALVFRTKDPRRIILVSDTVKGGRPLYKNGVLQGGGLALSGCAAHLGKLGIPKRKISMALWDNPTRYLNLRIK